MAQQQTELETRKQNIIPQELTVLLNENQEQLLSVAELGVIESLIRPENLAWGEDLTDDDIQVNRMAYELNAMVYEENEEWNRVWEESLRMVHANLYAFLDKISLTTEGKFGFADVGCATGRLVNDLITKYRGKSRIVGFDVSAAMALRGKKRLEANDTNPQAIFQGDLLDINTWREVKEHLKGVPLKAVTCQGSIPHIKKEERREFLELIYNSLDKDGLLYFSEKVSSDGKVFRDTRIGAERAFTTMNALEIFKLLSVAKEVGFRTHLTILERHHDPKKPSWFEMFLVKGNLELNGKKNE